MGQNFEYVGPQVTVLSKYIEATPELQPYDPALSRAYGYYPNTEIINRFWGRPSAVGGSYADGKAVLTGTHPEYYPQTEKFLINTLFYLNSDGPFLIDVQSLPPLEDIAYLEPTAGGPLGSNPVSIINKIDHLKDLSAAARKQLLGLESENEAITDAPGEFIVTFLDDQISRCSELEGDILKMVRLYKNLSRLQVALEEHRVRYSAGTI